MAVFNAATTRRKTGLRIAELPLVIGFAFYADGGEPLIAGRSRQRQRAPQTGHRSVVLFDDAAFCQAKHIALFKTDERDATPAVRSADFDGANQLNVAIVL